MRTEKEFEEERFFGIQKFSTPEEAFKVLEGKWGTDALDMQEKFLVATDETFKKAILIRAVEKYLEYKDGKITWEECSQALDLSEKVTDYLLDFDFFLYSKFTKCYYTCRMTMKDDLVYMWNKRQWGYYNELSELYSFELLVGKAMSLVDPLYEDGKKPTREEIDRLYDEEDLYVY